MTADRFGPPTPGQYRALAASRASAADRLAAPSAPPIDPQAAPSATAPSATAPSTTAPTIRGRRRADWRPVLPPQHGAWAFLLVPVLGGVAVAGSSAAAWLFLLAWLCAYPTAYFAGRAATARVRRGSWTRLARREASRAVPWAVLTALFGLPLLIGAPWLLAVGVVLLVLWGSGLVLAARRGERSLANDTVLVLQSLVAIPVVVGLTAGPAALSGSLARPTAEVTAAMALYLGGSVLHVKSLLREARRVRFRRADVAWHVAAAVLTGLASPGWLIGFGPALIRAVVARPGMSVALVGGIEAVVAVLVVVATFLVI